MPRGTMKYDWQLELRNDTLLLICVYVSKTIGESHWFPVNCTVHVVAEADEKVLVIHKPWISQVGHSKLCWKTLCGLCQMFQPIYETFATMTAMQAPCLSLRCVSLWLSANKCRRKGGAPSPEMETWRQNAANFRKKTIVCHVLQQALTMPLDVHAQKQLLVTCHYKGIVNWWQCPSWRR